MSTPIEVVMPPPQQRTPRAERLPLRFALTAVPAAFLLAQLFGALASNVANAVMPGGVAAHGGKAAEALRMIPPMLASELALVLVALATPLLANLSLRRTLDLRPERASVFVAAAVGTVMLGPLGDSAMSELSRMFPKLTLGVVPALRETAALVPFPVLWPTFALLPGVAEELLFRGVLQGALGRTLRSACIAGSAFALFHIDPVHVAGVLPLGLFLSWVAYRSSTLVSIFAHVANNSLAVFSIHSSVLDVGYGTGREVPSEWLFGSLGVFVVAVIVITRETRTPG